MHYYDLSVISITFTLIYKHLLSLPMSERFVLLKVSFTKDSDHNTKCFLHLTGAALYTDHFQLLGRNGKWMGGKADGEDVLTWGWRKDKELSIICLGPETDSERDFPSVNYFERRQLLQPQACVVNTPRFRHTFRRSCLASKSELNKTHGFSLSLHNVIEMTLVFKLPRCEKKVMVDLWYVYNLHKYCTYSKLHGISNNVPVKFGPPLPGRKFLYWLKICHGVETNVLSSINSRIWKCVCFFLDLAKKVFVYYDTIKVKVIS